jgi:hypothetical protein
MKKVCVILNGCIRNNLEFYIKTIDSINNFFDGMHNDYIVDIYIHTWASQEEYRYDQDRFVEIFSRLKNIKHIIIDDTSHTVDTVKNLPYNKQTLQNNFIPTVVGIYNSYKAFKTCFDYIDSTGIKYDIALRARNDVILTLIDREELFKKIQEDNICIPPSLCHGYINDTFIIGEFDTIKSSICYDTLDEFCKIVESSWNPEEIMLKVINPPKKIFIFPVSEYIVRGHKFI